MIALGCLPLTAFGCTLVALANLRPAWGWRRAFIRGLLATGAFMVAGTELLSLAHVITRLWLAMLWALPTIGGAVFLAMRWRRGPGILLPEIRLPGGWVWRSLLMMAVIVLVITGVVAWFAPPQTWDSLTYHTARVAHWAQDRSIGHYATGIERQNLMSPGAEIGVLQLYVLTNGDQLANFIQWFAMASSLVVVAIIAGRLGAGPVGQLLAAVFVATLPMGISEATSTMTDYVVALWLACLAAESLAYLQGNGGADTYLFLGISSGLAVLVKPIAFPYLLPFAAAIAWGGLRCYGLRRLAAGTLVVVLGVTAINLGYMGRNALTYGNPLGTSSKVDTHSNQILNVKVVISNLLRNASLQAGTPWPEVNRQIFRAVTGLHVKMGMDPNDPRTSVHNDFQVLKPSPDEVRSGDLVQAVLSLMAVIGLAAWAPWHRKEAVLPLLLVVLAAVGFVALGAVFKFTVFGSRYHLPFFVLIAPPVAWTVDRLKRPFLMALIGLAMLVYAWSWLVSLNPRPLLPNSDGLSVLTTPRDRLYLTIAPGLTPTYLQMAELINSSSCQSVGIMLGGDAAEYPFWAYLGEPQGGRRLEWLVSGTPSARYRDPAFRACAVICDSSCPDEWTTINGLPLGLKSGSYRLFLSR
jgi:hypothetical protein